MTLHSVCEARTGNLRARPVAIVETVGHAVARAVTTLLDWQQRASQRRQLSGLDTFYLKDMGIDRAAAHREASKPFWRD